jgi:hypothetical protein
MEERLRVLGLIESGDISAAEGIRLLEALGEHWETQEDGEAQAIPSAPTAVVPPVVVRVVWQVVFWSGVALLVIGGLLVTAVYAWQIPGYWLAWGGAFLGLGLLVTPLGWWLQRARWLSLRVQEPDGPRISFALPLPLGLMAWALRIARPFAPELADTGVDELVLALKDEWKDGQPLVIDVKEGEQGEKVQIYLG